MWPRTFYFATAVLIASVAIFGNFTPAAWAADKLTAAEIQKHGDALKKNTKTAPTHTVKSHVKVPPKVVDGKKVYKGTIKLSHPKKGDAEITYTITQSLTKGPNDHTMVVKDTTNKRTFTFGLNEATGVMTMKAGGTTVSVKHNPDKSWTVDGVNYKDLNHAGVAMVSNKAFRKASGPHVFAGAGEALKVVKPGSKSSSAKATQAVNTAQQAVGVIQQVANFFSDLF